MAGLSQPKWTFVSPRVDETQRDSREIVIVNGGEGACEEQTGGGKRNADGPVMERVSRPGAASTKSGQSN